MFIIKPEKDYYFQESERLRFSPLRKEHINLWEPFFEGNEYLPFLGFNSLNENSASFAEKWISKQMERKNQHQFGQLAVFEKKNEHFIGLAGIIQREISGNIEYEITYSLLAKYRGKGFATEAAIMFKEFIFSKTLVQTAISIIHIENQNSIRVAKKNGMSISSETKYMDMPVYIFRITKN